MGGFFMEHSLINVLIADDETIVRDGLKYIIDWEKLGFFICDEAGNGQDALTKINLYQPGLVLLDIKMPKMDGTVLIKTARENGFTGDFIVLSGYSDFKYAQAALHYGASFYLTKPIDEDILTDAILSVKEKIQEKEKKENSFTQYLEKAKYSVLYDLLTGHNLDQSINFLDLGLYAPVYQVIIYQNYTPFYSSYSFIDLLQTANHDVNFLEHIQINNYDVVLLKGSYAIDRFHSCLQHYKTGTQKGSPLDSIFLAYGPTICHITEIKKSYNDCTKLLKRRFFCEENQHVLSCDQLPCENDMHPFISPALSQKYSNCLINYIQTYNRRMISETLDELKNTLFDSSDEVIAIKHFLADIFLQIKQSIMNTYENISIPFSHNAAIIELIENKNYLYEILLYFTNQLEMIIRAIGNNSSESVCDDILYYIEHNYQSSLKLESIAPLFGYNSSYLGKLFSHKVGQSFNSYLDKVRIEHSLELLHKSDMKIYEIATKVGYRNVDYFHQKFKKIMCISPAEYRKKLD